MLYIIWGLSGVVCALLAGPKNRSVLGWFIGGCLFGLFAILAIAIVPKLEEEG